MDIAVLPKLKRLLSDISGRREAKCQSLDVSPCLETKRQSLLERKRSLEKDLILYHQQHMILRELEVPVEQMITSEEIARDVIEPQEILSEAMAVHQQNLLKMETTKQLLLEALDNLNKSLNELSGKIISLEKKYASFTEDFQRTGSLSQTDMNPKCLARAKERILIVLKNAEEEKSLIQERVARLESMCQLVDVAAVCVDSEAESGQRLDVVQERLSGLELLTGIKCRIVDDQTVNVYFIDTASQRLPEDSKLVVTLSFVKDDSQCLALSKVETNLSFPQVDTILKEARKDQDLPKLIRNLKKAWLSYVPLVTEISSLRESYAIDWKSEDRSLHLLIGKGVVCCLSIPLFYPLGEETISLDQVMGADDTTTPQEMIAPPENLSLTGWVMHLESIFGKSCGLKNQSHHTS